MAVADEVERKSAPGGDSPEDRQVRQRLGMMMLIRRFEERTYQEYQKKYTGLQGEQLLQIGGFCHLCSGQEAVSVGLASLFEQGRDYLVNGYRDHGHALALGMEPRLAMAELFGKATGCSKGKGGSMHFFDIAGGNLGGHGIVGAHVPLGIGAAFACHYKKTGGVVFTLFGDGALNQGAFHEALNLASLWKLPCILICENNGVAMGTQVARASAEKDLVKRGSGYAMPCRGFDGNDVDEVMSSLGEAVERARAGQGPTYLVANTYRYRGHSMSDAMAYRTKEELAAARERDPIKLYEDRLRARHVVNDARLEEMDAEVRGIVEDAVQFASSSPHPDPSALYQDILSEKYPLQK